MRVTHVFLRLPSVPAGVENTLLSLFLINSSMDVVALDEDRSGQSTGPGVLKPVRLDRECEATMNVTGYCFAGLGSVHAQHLQ
jgi:hypothetical protein